MPDAPHRSFAKGAFESDVYRSCTAEDVELFRQFTDHTALPVSDAFVDFLGRITRSRFIHTCAPLVGLVSRDPPIPSDGFYADTIEYTGLLMAIQTVENNRLVVAELGAAWGPWLAAAGVAARLKGIAEMDLVGVEASRGKVEHMKEHLADNGLRPRVTEDRTYFGNIRCRCIHGAVWHENGTAQFPIVDAGTQFGAAAVAEVMSSRGVDYRGQTFDYEEVPAYRIPDILEDYPVVDFIHIDVQGSEVEVCRAAIDFLAKRVRFIFIGTHSRSIEGELIELLLPAGFSILREKPCRFLFEAWPGTLEGLTAVDGGQLWRNNRFA